MIRILLVDDQNLIQQGIKSILDRDPEFKVISTVTDGRTAIKQIDILKPDVVLLDIEMPGMDGITTTKYISHLSPQTKVIILSSHEEKKYVIQALMAGAKSYILKSSLAAELKQAIVAVNSGYTHIESRLLSKVFDPSKLKSRIGKNPEHSSAPQEVAVTARNFTSPAVKNATANRSNVPLSLEATMHHENSESGPSSDKGERAKPVPKINLPELDLVAQHDSQFNPSSSPRQSVGTSAIDTRFLPATIIKRSALASNKPAGNFWQQLATEINKNKQIRQINNKPEIVKLKVQILRWNRSILAQIQPMLASLEANLVRYWQRLLPLVKRWQAKGWLTNVGLVVLGIIVAITLRLLFS